MPAPLLLDSNLTILLAVGLADQRYIAEHKRLSAYDATDFAIVTALVAASSGIVFAPNVLTEASNLLRQIDDPIRTHVSQSLAAMVSVSSEVYVESKTAVLRSEYPRLGLTDSILLTLSVGGGRLLTADLGLYLAAAAAGFEAVNYNHVREQRPDFR